MLILRLMPDTRLFRDEEPGWWVRYTPPVTWLKKRYGHTHPKSVRDYWVRA